MYDLVDEEDPRDAAAAPAAANGGAKMRGVNREVGIL